MLTVLIIREVQIKTIMRYQLIAVRMPSLKGLQITNAEEGVEKREPSYTVGENVNWIVDAGSHHHSNSALEWRPQPV